MTALLAVGAVTLGTLGDISCTAPNNAVPGTYARVESGGSVVGTTYTQDSDDDGEYTTNTYTAPGATPGPTPTPIVIPSTSPTAPGAVLWIVYYGEYTIPTTAGFSTAPTNGCFTLYTANLDETEESVNRRVIMSVPSPTPTPFIAEGIGYPTFAYPYPSMSDDILDSDVTSFTITNLTRTTGTGTFTLDTNAVGDVTTVSGTATITGSMAFYSTEDEGDSFKRHIQFKLRSR